MDQNPGGAGTVELVVGPQLGGKWWQDLIMAATSSGLVHGASCWIQRPAGICLPPFPSQTSAIQWNYSKSQAFIIFSSQS